LNPRHGGSIKGPTTTEDAMKLYYLPGACSLGDHIVLEWIGKPYQAQRMTHETIKSPEYLAMNPSGAVPVLEEDDGWTLTENVAILTYLADSNPGLGLTGDGSLRGRAEVYRALGFLNSDVHKAFAPLFGPQKFLVDESTHEALKEGARVRIRGLLARLDGELGDGDWLVGNRRSVADPYLFVILRWADARAGGIGAFPNLERFRRRMLADPAVARVLADEGLD
jgi:glutathione S-transferase